MNFVCTSLIHTKVWPFMIEEEKAILESKYSYKTEVVRYFNWWVLDFLEGGKSCKSSEEKKFYCHIVNLTLDKIAIEDQLWDHLQANNKVIYGLGIMSARVWNLKKQNVVVDSTLCKVRWTKFWTCWILWSMLPSMESIQEQRTWNLHSLN